jgi:hypothetical protein
LVKTQFADHSNTQKIIVLKNNWLYFWPLHIYQTNVIRVSDGFSKLFPVPILGLLTSAADYQETGSINVGELQLKLLQKIEELTLYNIQLMKDIEDLKKNQTELVEKLSNLNQ